MEISLPVDFGSLDDAEWNDLEQEIVNLLQRGH